jgi:hypothetical protein
VITDTDSNGWGGETGYVDTLSARPDGLTDIDENVIRDGKNLKGRIIGFGLGTPLGKHIFEKGLTSTVLAIEARTTTLQMA